MKAEGFIDGLKRLLHEDVKPRSTRHMKPIEEAKWHRNDNTKKQVTDKIRKAKRRRSNNSRKNNRP